MIGASDLAPGRDCPRCPRLVAFRVEQRRHHPDWHNAPVQSFGPIGARLLIVGLAPGLQGANRTGRPFTGDYAGNLLYATLLEFGFAQGRYAADAGDGLSLVDCRITNAARCVPPQNKPTVAEIAACRPFLIQEMRAMPALEAVLALGRIAHDSVVAARSLKRARHVFGHGASHDLGDGLRLFDCYHCSRYNTNTGRLTVDMFKQVFSGIAAYIAI
jgi:uracil-DNA glycosylase family 4